MKKANFTYLFIFTLLPFISWAQGVGINTDNSTADPSAMLDVKSTTKGTLVPRMTMIQRNAIVTPATSLLIYQSDNTPGFYYYNGTVWVPIAGVASSGWGTTGNTGTTSGTNFIGTTDAQSLDIRTNNIIRTRITQKGQIEPLNTGRSVFLGEGAGANDDLTNNENVFLGYNSGSANTTGTLNTFVGHNTGAANTAGQNTFIGSSAGALNTSGDANVFVGRNAGGANTTGFYNDAFGNAALRLNTTGQRNIALGHASLFFNTTGTHNTGSGAQALYNNTTGIFNTGSGWNTLNVNRTGSYNTALGSLADVTVDGLINATAIGYNAKVSASNKVQIGDNVVNHVQLGTGPNVTLETGRVIITGGAPGAGKVLTSDAVGYASWETPAGGPAAHYVGESYGGGTVFYVYDGGQHGLIAANVDANSGTAVPWSITNLKTSTFGWGGIGSGESKTSTIIAVQAADAGLGSYAALVARDYWVVDAGVRYGDFYLPCVWELELLYYSNVFTWTIDYYWTSSEQGSTNALVYRMLTSGAQWTGKAGSHQVRPIRRF